ncbi:gliding motility-associated C-terminal domain-containing protein [Flavobacterium sp.]|uniref:T9SS type B sorting domain-containing protein n=1 Tax=Flavobacterium sp. TaxID=239 RepID=UPI002C0DF47F|nr:gliding motility-associated C-terminal domain-containing protein [Flavobacterium sp.]HSD06884.1 gliding motility-associated C-terminal domain-containing protein [Flavobacterium sp.]
MKSETIPVFPFSKFLFFLILLVLPIGSLFAQTISPQKLPFDKICAGGPHPTDQSKVFNEYQAQFIVSGFDPSVTFSVVLSDPSGSFSSPIATIPLSPLEGTPPDTATDKTLTFAIPTNLIGSDNYELRVKSSTGILSPSSFTIYGTVSKKSFPAYYKSYNGAFFINDKKPTISFCNGGSVTLTVYNPTPSDINSSPANFPQLKYNWYKDGVLISGQSSSSLTVNSPGVYYAELNYGPCTDVNFRSQEVIVSSSSGSGGSSSITSSLGNPFCSGSENTTLTAAAGNSYVWKKDGAVIVGATDQTYKTNSAGIYTCDIDFGGCKATASIDLKTTATITANGKEVSEGETLSVAQGGDPLTVTATATVSNPTYQWFHNNEAIDGATQNTLDITIAGNYKVVISGCTTSFIVKYSSVIDYNVPKISNIITPNNDGINDTWIIPNIYNNTNTHVVILSSLGEIVFETDNYDNSNGWPQSNIEFKNFNPVYYYIITPNGGSAKKGSITLLK